MGGSAPRAQPLPSPPSTVDEITRQMRERLRAQARTRSGFGNRSVAGLNILATPGSVPSLIGFGSRSKAVGIGGFGAASRMASPVKPVGAR